MKNIKTLTILFFSLCALSLSSCDDEQPYTASEKIAPYVDRFFSEAAERGVTLSRSNFTVRPMQKSSNTLVGGELTADNQKKFLYNPIMFTDPDRQENFAEIELSIYSVLKSLVVTGSVGKIDTTVEGFGEVTGSALTEDQVEKSFDQLF